MKLSDCTAALVMPSSCVAARRRRRRHRTSAASLPSASSRARSSSNASLLTILPASNFESPGSLIFTQSLQPVVDLAEGELVDHRAGQQAGVAHRLDLHLAQHLRRR